MTVKLTENETTIKNLREQVEKLMKIQEQQKQQVKLMKISMIASYCFAHLETIYNKINFNKWSNAFERNSK